MWKDQKFSIIPALAITMGPDATLDVNAGTNNLTWGSNATLANATATRSKGRRGNSAAASGGGRSGFPPGQHAHRAAHVARTQCSVVKIQQGDSCWSIATERCNIKLEDFYRYNGGSNAFCNNLGVGDYVCCTAGDKPNMDPAPNPDGSCKYVQVQAGDSCWSIANQRCGGLKLDQLYKFNGGSDT